MNHAVALLGVIAEKFGAVCQIGGCRLGQGLVLFVIPVDILRGDVHAVYMVDIIEIDDQPHELDTVSLSQLRAEIGGAVAGDQDLLRHA